MVVCRKVLSRMSKFACDEFESCSQAGPATEEIDQPLLSSVLLADAPDWILENHGLEWPWIV